MDDATTDELVELRPEVEDAFGRAVLEANDLMDRYILTADFVQGFGRVVMHLIVEEGTDFLYDAEDIQQIADDVARITSLV